MLTMIIPARTITDWWDAPAIRSHMDRRVMLLCDGKRPLWKIADCLNLPVFTVQIIVNRLKENHLLVDAESNFIAPSSFRRHLSDADIIRAFDARFSRWPSWVPQWVRDLRLRSQFKTIARWQRMSQDQQQRYIYG